MIFNCFLKANRLESGTVNQFSVVILTDMSRSFQNQAPLGVSSLSQKGSHGSQYNLAKCELLLQTFLRC